MDVDMMNLADVDVAMGGGEGYTAVELPYGGQAYSMVVVLPHETSDVRSFLAGLDPAAWNALVSGSS